MADWVRRRQGEDALPLTLQRRRLYILPTRAGLAFTVLLFLMLLAGLNYANSVALFLTLLLGGFGLVTMHLCHRNLLGITLSGATASTSFAQHSGTLDLSFENPAGLPRLRIEAGVDCEPTTPTDVPSRGRARIVLRVATRQRGILKLSRLRLTTVHPFGLFRTWTWIHAPIEMIVYPRAQGTLPVPVVSGVKLGERSQLGAGADEWLGLRPFRDGDSPRQVDWKAYAREAPLLVKEYSSSGAELRLFSFAQLNSLEVEARLEQLARWIVDAEARTERYGLELPSIRIEPDRGPEHRHRCLTALATYGLEE